jgi:hypothetical protein
MNDERIRVQVTPTWSIAIPPRFEQLDHGDSWQAHDEHRSIYLSSMIIDNGSVPVKDIVSIAEAWLASESRKSNATAKTEPAARHHSGEVRGEATVFPVSGGLELSGFMAAHGSIVVCVIDFDDAKFQSWAIDTWRSIQSAKN